MSKAKVQLVKLPEIRPGAEQGPIVVVNGRFGLPNSEYNPTGISGTSISVNTLDRIQKRLPRAMALAKVVVHCRDDSSVKMTERAILNSQAQDLKVKLANVTKKLVTLSAAADEARAKYERHLNNMSDQMDFIVGRYIARFKAEYVSIGCRRVKYKDAPKYIALIRKAIKNTARKAKR